MPQRPSVSAPTTATAALERKASSLEMTARGATARPLSTKTNARTRMTGTTSGRAKSSAASGAARTVTAATASPVTGVLHAMVAADSRTPSFSATNAGRSPESWNGPTKASSRLAIATSPKSCGERTRASSRLVAIAITCVAPKEKAIHAAPRAARRPSAGVRDAGADPAPLANATDASRDPGGLRAECDFRCLVRLLGETGGWGQHVPDHCLAPGVPTPHVVRRAIVAEGFAEDDGWISAGVGVGEAMLWSHPWTGRSDLQEYQARFNASAGARVSWAVLPYGRGLKVQVRF